MAKGNGFTYFIKSKINIRKEKSFIQFKSEVINMFYVF